MERPRSSAPRPLLTRAACRTRTRAQLDQRSDRSEASSQRGGQFELDQLQAREGSSGVRGRWCGRSGVAGRYVQHWHCHERAPSPPPCANAGLCLCAGAAREQTGTDHQGAGAQKGAQGLKKRAFLSPLLIPPSAHKQCWRPAPAIQGAPCCRASAAVPAALPG